MPRLSDSMEEGTIIRWLKSSGEEVRLGEAIAEIETDKATMTYEADAAGFLQIVAAEGQPLAIGALIARLLGSATEAAAPVEAEAVAAPAPAAPAAEPELEFVASAASAAPAAAASGSGGRVKASPVARRTAAQLGVDLANVVGSGPDGRIVKADVVAAGNGGAARAPRHRRARLEGLRRGARADPRAAGHRAADGRREGDGPRVPGDRRGGCRGGVRSARAAARPGGAAAVGQRPRDQGLRARPAHAPRRQRRLRRRAFRALRACQHRRCGGRRRHARRADRVRRRHQAADGDRGRDPRSSRRRSATARSPRRSSRAPPSPSRTSGCSASRASPP